MNRPLLTLSLIALSIVPSVTAHADAAAEARFHDEAARRHFAAGRYEAAVREFMIEQRLAPNANILFNIALCFEHMEEHEEAYTYFAEFLEQDDEDADRRARATASLEALRPRVALVAVTSQPAGAAIYVDRRELGRYGVTPRVIALPPGERRVWVELDGHRPAERRVTLEAGRQIPIALQPEQILGRLALRVDDPAEVRVLDANGELVWEGPAPVETPLAPGTYRVEARRGEERWADAVRVRADATTEVRAELAPPTGELTVVADAPGALIRLDGREVGFTPQMLAVAVGAHDIEVSGEARQPYSGSVEVEEGRALWMDVSLSPAPRGPFTDEVFALGGVALAVLAAAGVFTGLTANAHGQYQSAQQNAQAYTALAADTQRFAVTADLLWLTGGGLAVMTIATIIVNLAEQSRPSTATISGRQP